MPALEVDPEEPGQGMAPSRSILAGTYNQTYLIRTPDAGEDAREAKGLSDDSDDGDSDSYVELRISANNCLFSSLYNFTLSIK